MTKARACLLCGSAQLAVTGLFLYADGKTMAVYHVCACCWQLGHEAVALLVEAALAGVFETVN